MPETINKYYIAFKKLKRGITKYGLAPHKPIMLLSILQGVKNNLIKDNRIYITPEIVYLFKSNWNSLVNTHNVCAFALPFFHLSREKSEFWHLKPKSGYAAILKMKESISSLNELNHAVEYANLNDDLFCLMKDDLGNYNLQQFLLDEFFPFTKSHFLDVNQYGYNLFDKVEYKILNEDSVNYKNEILQLIEQKDEEEIFVRGCLFKREIPKIYNNTCSISGMRIDAIANISMIDACHIVPFSESYNDTVTNGIALCPNLHRAFDRGLISISDNYRVLVKKNFVENSKSVFNTAQFQNEQILLPQIQSYYPSLENLHHHRKRFNF